jgi:hypothetical protein
MLKADRVRSRQTRDDRIVRHIAITGTASDINVNWMQQVTDEQYRR